MSYIGQSPTSVAFLTDTFSGNGSTVAFTMSVAPATTTSILVAITGVVQDPSTYSIVGTTLTFSAAPPSGTNNISVRYLGIPASGVATTAYRTQTEFTATAGQTTFSVPSYTVGYIDVYRNGLLLGSSDFTATNGTTVVLAAAASAGDFIETVSFFVSSVLNAIPATAGAVNSTYLAGGVALANIGAGGVTQSYLGTNVAGNGPAFSAYRGTTTQAVSATTYTKIQFNVEEFDTNSNYDNTTNYRFTPTVAGYYQVNCLMYSTTGTAANFYGYIYKNGAIFKASQTMPTGGGGTSAGMFASALIYMNGSTDYIEGYLYVTQAATVLNDAAYNYFQASLVRAA
jgi:hypothetical protein